MVQQKLGCNQIFIAINNIHSFIHSTDPLASVYATCTLIFAHKSPTDTSEVHLYWIVKDNVQ